MFRRFVVLMAAALPFAVAAEIRVIEEIVVKCNGDIITRGDLQEKARQQQMGLVQEQHLSGQALAAAMQDFQNAELMNEIDQLLLVQKAKDLQINVDGEVARRIAEAQVVSKISDPDKFHDWIRENTGISFEELKQQWTNSALTRRVIGQEIGSRIAVPEADMQKYYDEHKADFVRKQEVFLSQILISTEGKTPAQVATAEAKAKDIVARARKGEKFSDLVAANSDDTETIKTGGQLPALQREQMREDMAKIVFQERKGYVTDPFRVERPQQGFLILKIEERHEAGQAAFDEVKDQIQEILVQPKMTPKVREYLTKLRQEAFLQIKDGYVDSGAAPGKDTRWHDVATLKPETTTKEEVAAHRKRKRFLGIIPHGGKPGPIGDTTTPAAGTPPATPPAAPATAPIKQ